MNYGRTVVERTLDELGISYEEKYGTPWAEAYCPFHDDETPSFTVHLDEGGWKCHAGCGSHGDLATLVSLVTEENAPDAKRRLRRGLSLDPNALLRVTAPPYDPNITITRSAPNDAELQYDKTKVPRYMLDRGFDMDLMREWEVGWDVEHKAVVIPVRYGGELVGVVRRFLRSKPKYKNSASLVKSEVLFGFDRRPPDARTAVLVEGPLDALWLYQHGYVGIATLGASLSQTQADVLARHFWEVALAYDPDPAGNAAALKARRLLRVAVTRVPIPEGKDVQNLDAVRLQSAIEARFPF